MERDDLQGAACMAPAAEWDRSHRIRLSRLSGRRWSRVEGMTDAKK